MLFIPEATHTTWYKDSRTSNRQDIQQSRFSWASLKHCSCYIFQKDSSKLQWLRLQPGWSQGKDIQTLPIFSGATLKILLLCYVSQRHSGIIKSCQDINLDEPERIHNICLAYHVQLTKKTFSCYVSQKHLGIKSCQDINLDELERIHNICLAYHVQLKKKIVSCYVSHARSTQAYNHARTSTWMNQKGYKTHNICLAYHVQLKKNIFMLIYCIPEALRHKIMPGHQPGWTRKDTQHTTFA